MKDRFGRREVKPCHCCLRVVAYLSTGGNKARVRHKCPHGKWCASGMGSISHHVNWPKCRECYVERMREYYRRTGGEKAEQDYLAALEKVKKK